jgi:BASS family bile acid:Na+ symporter
MNSVGVLSLVSVFAAMFALGAGSRPMLLVRQLGEFGLLARCLGMALIAVPAVAMLAGSLFALQPAALAGLLLIGISPGAPMALRRSREHGGHASFSIVLQVAVALLAIVAVPAWVLLLDLLYGAHADIDLVPLAHQVLMAQLLPLGLGVACALFQPSIAARLAGPLLRLSGIMLLVICALVLWQVGPLLPGLGMRPFGASALLAASAIGLGHWVGGPAADTRTTSAIVCALRNPGIALLVASTNAMSETAKQVVMAHVLVTTLLLLAYLAARRRWAGPAEAPRA